MSLNFEKLIKFDLLDRLEENRRDYFYNRFIALIDIIIEIITFDQFIKEIPSFPGSTDKIIRSEMNMAIGSTLAIEGIHLNSDEIEESFRKSDANETLKRKEQEAQNSRNVYNFIIETVNTYKTRNEQIIITESLIKQIHKLFTENLNYVGNNPGDYRGDFTATFGSPRREGLCKTRAEVEQAMKELVKWLNNEEANPRRPQIKAILAHYYLTEIHPFSDGNGRTARALEALILYLNGINTYCFWSLANFWSANRDEYIAKLGQIRLTSDPFEFIEWGLNGYLVEIKRIKERVLKKLKQLMLKDHVRYLLNNKNDEKIKITRRIVSVMELLIDAGQPVPLSKFISSPQIKTLYKVPSTWYRDLKKMRTRELVTITSDKNGVEQIEPNFSILDRITYNVR